MTIDFFVHPEFAKHKKICKYHIQRKRYIEYISKLIDVLKISDFPILIKYKGDNFFNKKILSENHFNSNEYGEIHSNEDFERISRLLEEHESDEMRIHGSFFGQCTRNFALQLFTYLRSGRNLMVGNSLELQSEYQYFGDILRSNIKYGVVFHRLDSEHLIRRLTYPQLPFGNVDRQLIDSQTHLYF